MLTIRDVLEATSGHLLGRGDLGVGLPRTTVDSRQVQSGDLFAALPGAKHDGHSFVTEAFARGAAAALVTRVPPDCPWAEDPSLDGPPLIRVPNVLEALHQAAQLWRSRHGGRVVAVAGSLASGTARELITAVLSARGPVAQTEAVTGPASPAPHSVPLTLLGLGSKDRYAVLELVGETPEEIGRLARIASPNVGVVMNVQPRSPSGEPTPSDVTAMAGELIDSLDGDGTAALNADDENVRSLVGATSARSLLFGIGPQAEVLATDILGRGLGGTEFDIQYAGHSVRVVLPFVGLRSVHAALAGATVGLAEGMALAEVAEALARASSSVRVMVGRGINGAQIVDDTYDAGPESVLAALNLLSELDGRKVAVLGDMLGGGPSEESDHVKIGSRAARVADVLVTVGPRASLAAAEARRVGLPQSAVIETPDAEAAVSQLRRLLLPGDSVLVKGSPELHMDNLVQTIQVEA